MTNSASPSHSPELLSSCSYQSVSHPGVTFTIRQMTLRQRINLLKELHDLYRELEFSNAGTSKTDRLNTQLNGLRIDEVFLRWGVLAIDGLIVDGKAVAASEISEAAPEDLVGEILSRIRECIALNSGEEKN